jgi:hypothetical protein
MKRAANIRIAVSQWNQVNNRPPPNQDNGPGCGMSQADSAP